MQDTLQQRAQHSTDLVKPSAHPRTWDEVRPPDARRHVRQRVPPDARQMPAAVTPATTRPPATIRPPDATARSGHHTLPPSTHPRTWHEPPTPPCPYSTSARIRPSAPVLEPPACLCHDTGGRLLTSRRPSPSATPRLADQPKQQPILATTSDDPTARFDRSTPATTRLLYARHTPAAGTPSDLVNHQLTLGNGTRSDRPTHDHTSDSTSSPTHDKRQQP